MAQLSPGTTLGPYRIIEQIGMGGMATVYKAYQPSMERYIALKILPDHYAQDPQFVARFTREARTIAKLEHKNILPVYDFGEENGTTYLVMRYLDGGTLKDIQAQGQLPLHDVVNIMTQICSALDYAHRQGVIHRDVKPANIIVDSEGAAYLTDFGIAKVLEAAESLTQTGAAIGTPDYMAPEQSLGQGVDARTDIYALGIILYELVVGRPPYQADTPMAVALAHIHQPLPLPTEVAPGVSELVEEVILKALAKTPDDRYQTANVLAKALQKAVQTARTVSAQAPDESVLPTLIMQVKAARPAAPPAPQVDIRARQDMPAAAAQPQKRKFSMPPLALGGLGLLALVVLGGFAIAALTGVFSGDSTPAPDASTPAVEAPVETDPDIYDNFDDPAYEGVVNLDLWTPVGNSEGGACDTIQRDGLMVVTNTLVADQGAECELLIRRPINAPGSELETLEARMQLLNDHDNGPFSGSLLRDTLDFGDNVWVAECGILADESNITLFFGITDTRVSEDNIHESFAPAAYDAWYTFQLAVDPQTMTFSCLVDGAEIGAYTPDNVAELQAGRFQRGVGNFRAPGAGGTVNIDDFFLIDNPPAEVIAETPPELYDNFDDPAYEGAINPGRWVLGDVNSCDMAQHDGMLMITSAPTAPTDDGSFCELLVNQPSAVPGSELESFEARMQISSDHNGPAMGSILRLTGEFGDGRLVVECGLLAENGNIEAPFYVADTRLGGGQDLHLSVLPAEYDTWYHLSLQIDPQSMTFTCLLNGEVIGTYMPENIAELQTTDFRRGVANWRSPDTQVTVLIDDFFLIDNPPAEVVAETPSELYDDFDNPEFDGGLNSAIWNYIAEEPGCEIVQHDGIMSIANDPISDYWMGCELFVRRPPNVPGRDLESLAAHMQILDDFSGLELGSMLMAAADFEGGPWVAECGIVAENISLIVGFHVYDERLGESPDGPTLHFSDYPIDFNTWYDVGLFIDPETMTVACLVDGEEIGSYTPGNPDELREASFQRAINNWRSSDTAATVLIDNFRLLDTPPAEVVAAASPELYDNFDDPAYDGGLNEDIWDYIVYEEPGCEIFQHDGVVSVVNEPTTARDITCELFLRRPLGVLGRDLQTLEADMQLLSDHNRGGVFSVLRIFADFETGPWGVDCGIFADETALDVRLYVYDNRLGDNPLEEASFPIDYDGWYTITLSVDPETMTVACLVNGEEVGSYTPENADELRTATFRRQIGNWRGAGTAATILIDNFRLLDSPPAEVVAEAPPDLYDDFDDPAYEGAINPDNWIPNGGDTPCEIFQHDGVLTITNAPVDDQEMWCELAVRKPQRIPGVELETLEAQMQLLGDHNGLDIGSVLQVAADFEAGVWFLQCGLNAGPNYVEVGFYVFDARLGVDGENLYSAAVSIDYDTWHVVQLQVNPHTMTFVCLVDGREVGVYTPENALELQVAGLRRTISSWRAPGAAATVLIDDFRLIPWQ